MSRRSEGLAVTVTRAWSSRGKGGWWMIHPGGQDSRLVKAMSVKSHHTMTLCSVQGPKARAETVPRGWSSKGEGTSCRQCLAGTSG